MFPFPELPVVTPDPSPRRRSPVERFGALFILGLLGLVVLVGMIAWFAVGVWSLRQVWRDTYVLHDAGRPLAERIDAAYSLSRSPHVNQRQFLEMSLRKSLPDLARYVLAESLTAEAVSADPRGYALMVARSEGWPDWLRLLLLRPLAYEAGTGLSLPGEPLTELRRHPDPIVSLWATYTQAVAGHGDPEAAEALAREAAGSGPLPELARLLLEAQRSTEPTRSEALDRATVWLHRHHPGAERTWRGWEVRAGHLIPKPALELHHLSTPPGRPAGAATPDESPLGKERRR